MEPQLVCNGAGGFEIMLATWLGSGLTAAMVGACVAWLLR